MQCITAASRCGSLKIQRLSQIIVAELKLTSLIRIQLPIIDDMTFSGSFDEKKLESYVERLLCRQGFELNSKKTTCVSASQQQRVTGIVVNEKPQISSVERRRIRQEVYYLSKNTVLSCMRYIGVQTTQIQYLTALQGRISFALQINPDDKKMQEYYSVVHTLLKKKIVEKRKKSHVARKNELYCPENETIKQ